MTIPPWHQLRFDHRTDPERQRLKITHLPSGIWVAQTVARRVSARYVRRILLRKLARRLHDEGAAD